MLMHAFAGLLMTPVLVHHVYLYLFLRRLLARIPSKRPYVFNALFEKGRLNISVFIFIKQEDVYAKIRLYVRHHMMPGVDPS